MQAVNKKMDPQKTLKTMQDFQKENMKMGMTEEMSKDTQKNLLFCLQTCCYKRVYDMLMYWSVTIFIIYSFHMWTEHSKIFKYIYLHDWQNKAFIKTLLKALLV